MFLTRARKMLAWSQARQPVQSLDQSPRQFFVTKPRKKDKRFPCKASAESSTKCRFESRSAEFIPHL